MAFITFSNVSKIYHTGKTSVKALNDVSVEFGEGKFIIVLGPSGSGKSTMLNLLGGIDRVTSGVIEFAGEKITDFNNTHMIEHRRAQIGFVFQFYNLIPTLTAYENIDISRRLGKKPLNTDEVIDIIGLKDRQYCFPSELSGGEMQRVSIARAVCKNPQLLLCDEPTGAVDSESSKHIIKLLHDMSRKYDKTVIIVTHNNAFTPSADMVVRLKDGKIVDLQYNECPIDVAELDL